jgi:Essential protein Yae1, N terminal
MSSDLVGPPIPTSNDDGHASHDDIWLEAGEHFTDSGQYAEAEAALRAAMTPDVHRLRTTHTTAGYREGFAASREAAVQPGFDEGHLLGAALGLRAGYLQGVMEGIERGLNVADLTQESRAALQLRMTEVKKDLQLQSLLGQQWIEIDGTWKWKVDSLDGEQPTIGTIANAHPMIRRANRLVGTYCRILGVERL